MSSRMYCLAVLGLSVALAGCGGASNEPVGVTAESATPAAFNAAGAPTVELSVPDMMCAEGCGAKVQEILAGQPAVKDVRIDFESKTAVVAVEDGEFNPDAAIAMLVDYQFPNSTLKTADR